MTKLVCVGDSITQGFQSAAISRTEWSYPAMVARALGLTVGSGQLNAAFRIPDFSGEGGQPLNMERILRKLGNVGNVFQWLEAIPATLVDQKIAEHYWASGEGAGPSNTGPVHHNLAVWGFSVSDAYMVTDGMCERLIAANRPAVDLNLVPPLSMYRTTRRALNPSFDITLNDLSQLDLVGKQDPDGKVENLIFALGANNVLGITLALELDWSESADVHRLPYQRSNNIWTLSDFADIWAEAEGRLKPLVDAGTVERVFLATVPNVTIPPIMRGVSPTALKIRQELLAKDPTLTSDQLDQIPGANEISADGLYEYYTHFWIWDDDFAQNPTKFPSLTRDEARQVQTVIAGYNALILDTASRNGWPVIRIDTLLDGFAFRRTRGAPKTALPAGLIAALQANPNTKTAWPTLDSRYIGRIGGQSQGGLFALDGVHPTTAGYGLVADLTLQTMKNAAVPGADPALLNWDEIVAADTLLTGLPNALLDLESFYKNADPLMRHIFDALQQVFLGPTPKSN